MCYDKNNINIMNYQQNIDALKEIDKRKKRDVITKKNNTNNNENLFFSKKMRKTIDQFII